MCGMAAADLNDLSAAVSEAIEKIDLLTGSGELDPKTEKKLWDIRQSLLEALPSTKTSHELAGRTKPRFNEGTKVTLTLKQLRRLVRESGLSGRVLESYQDDVDKSVYSTWLAFINKFGAEETAKVLAYRDSVGRSVIKVEDMIAKYAEDEEGTSTEEVIYPLYEKAKSVGLSTDAAQLYFDYVFTKYDKFLYDTLGDQGYLGYACKYWVEDEVLKALEGRERVYLLVFEGVDEQDKDDTLPWNDALDALKAKFDVAAEGTTKNEGYQYAVLVEKNDNAVKESSFADDATEKVEKKRYVVKSDGSGYADPFNGGLWDAFKSDFRDKMYDEYFNSDGDPWYVDLDSLDEEKYLLVVKDFVEDTLIDLFHALYDDIGPVNVTDVKVSSDSYSFVMEAENSGKFRAFCRKRFGYNYPKNASICKLFSMLVKDRYADMSDETVYDLAHYLDRHAEIKSYNLTDYMRKFKDLCINFNELERRWKDQIEQYAKQFPSYADSGKYILGLKMDVLKKYKKMQTDLLGEYATGKCQDITDDLKRLSDDFNAELDAINDKLVAKGYHESRKR